jgi:hypothetical protein
MQQSSKPGARSKTGRALGTVVAALLCVAALSQPNPAYAHGGGGGFHGGGGGFHGGGAFQGGGFHGGFGGFRGDGFHGDRFRGGFIGFGLYPYYGYYPYYGDYDYYGDYSQPYSQVWYYCSDPAGYYPYVTQCYTGWQTVPAS